MYEESNKGIISVVVGIIIHLFVIAAEVGLLLIQFSRASAVAENELPSLADQDIGSIAGYHVFGALWVAVVVIFTYWFWSAVTARLDRVNGEIVGLQDGSSAISNIGFAVLMIINVCVIVGEFYFFSLMVVADADDLVYMVAGLFVVAHQACSFWISTKIFAYI